MPLTSEEQLEWAERVRQASESGIEDISGFMEYVKALRVPEPTMGQWTVPNDCHGFEPPMNLNPLRRAIHVGSAEGYIRRP